MHVQKGWKQTLPMVVINKTEPSLSINSKCTKNWCYQSKLAWKDAISYLKTFNHWLAPYGVLSCKQHQWH